MKIQCPQCGGNNFYVTAELGFCFNCRYTEKENKEVVTRVRSKHIPEIRLLYGELANYYHSCLDTEHRDYLHARGITDATIDTLKIGYCPPAVCIYNKHPLAEYAGIGTFYAHLADRIVFPYLRGETVTDLRGRLWRGDGEKYLSLKHSAFYRGADFSYLIDITADDVIITEGEIKAILPVQHGIAAHGLPGMNSYRLPTLTNTRRQVIIFDTQADVRLQRYVNAAVHNLAPKLDTPYVAFLPLRGEEKQDTDSYILRYGIDAFKIVANNALPYAEWSRYAA